MFTQSCYIKKNTKELRDKLIALGYKLNHGKAWGKYLVCFKINGTEECRFVASPEYDLENMPNYENAIYCGTNEALFLAIAALRDDSDINQWFITEVNQAWVNIGTYMPKGSLFKCLTEHIYPKEFDGIEQLCSSVVPSHKATVKELIEHFSTCTKIDKNCACP